MRKIISFSVISLLVLTVPLPTVQASEPSESAVYRITKKYVIKNYGSNQALEENVIFYLLENSEPIGQQILNETIEVEGTYKDIEILTTEDNRRGKIVGMSSMRPGETRTIKAIYVLRVDSIPQIDSGTVKGPIPSNLMKFTTAVNGVWNSDHSLISNKALELTENEINYWYKARQIFDFVQERLTYELQTVAQGDIWAYRNREGDCSEYASLYISLARAAGIPAKFVGGYLYSFAEDRASTTGLGNYGHAFAIIYLPNVGWVPVDPTEAQQGGGGYFAELPFSNIVELTSDGSNLSTGARSETPSVSVNWTHYIGRETDVAFEDTSVNILPAVAVDPTVYTDETIRDGILRFIVEIRNAGTQNIENVTVKLKVDNTYFNPSPPQTLDDVPTGIKKNLFFDVGVKKSVENSTISVEITYDSPYGAFKSVENVSVIANVAEGGLELPFGLNLTTILIILIIIGGVAVISAALFRR